MVVVAQEAVEAMVVDTVTDMVDTVPEHVSIPGTVMVDTDTAATAISTALTVATVTATAATTAELTAVCTSLLESGSTATAGDSEPDLNQMHD